MRLGIFGGTFNPVHLGHLENARHILEKLQLDRILFIPVKTPVHKKLDGNVSPEDRMAMLELALDGEKMCADPMEILRSEPSYTVYTLKTFREKYSTCELFLIMGSDSFNSIDTWKDYDEILGTAGIVVITRPGDEEIRPELRHMCPGLIYAENEPLNISSSCIRRRVRDGSSIKGLVPDAVAEYIKEKGLYLN